jgi:hypothetical protein
VSGRDGPGGFEVNQIADDAVEVVSGARLLPKVWKVFTEVALVIRH